MRIKAPEGAAAGAGAGAAIDGMIGPLAGIGALALPGLGLFVCRWNMGRSKIDIPDGR